jgi:hypothetical protein
MHEYINTDLNPIDIDGVPWLYERKEKNMYCGNGKWMLFYEKQLFNEKWKIATKLFRQNKLKNIISMKCSTNYNNPRASSLNEGVIILYCHTDNKFDIINAGNNILKLFNYDKIMYYKTNEQTAKGTKATGSIKNYTYYLEPKCNFIDDFD